MIDSIFCNELKRQVFLVVDPVLVEAEQLVESDNYNAIQLMCLELIQSVEDFIATFSLSQDLGESLSQ
jgi:hypothetical protein